MPLVPGGSRDRRLQPARVSELIETGGRILRRHWHGLLGAAAIFLLVPALLDSVSSQHFWDVLGPLVVTTADGTTEFTATAAQLDDLLVAGAGVLLTTLLAACVGTVATVAFATYVDRDYRGEGVTLGGSVRHALRRGPVAFALAILTNLLLFGLIAGGGVLIWACVTLLQPSGGSGGGLGVFLALVVIVALVAIVVTLSIRLCVAPAAVALEDVSPVKALRRSWQLTRDNAWRTFGLTVVVELIVTILSSLVSEVFGAAIAGVADPLGTATWIAGNAVLSVVFAPVLPVILVALYFDLRVRNERFDLGVPGTGEITPGA